MGVRKERAPGEGGETHRATRAERRKIGRRKRRRKRGGGDREGEGEGKEVG